MRLSEHGRSPGGASRATRTTPHLCRAAVDSLAHSSDLPPALVAKVPQREKLILSFVLAFIKDQAPPHPARALCPRPRPLLPPPPLPSARALQASALALCPPAPALAAAIVTAGCCKAICLYLLISPHISLYLPGPAGAAARQRRLRARPAARQGGRYREIHRELWGDVGRYGEMWGDMRSTARPAARQGGRYREIHRKMWGDMGRCGEI